MAEYQSLPQYDYLRRRAKEESDLQKQEQEDALNRRFAQLGTLQSGAALKVKQQASEASNKQLADVQGQIGAQEAAEVGQRQFATSEREATQTFQKTLVDEDRAFKGKYADLDNAFREKEFQLNQQATTLNAAVALKNAGLSPSEISGINETLKKLGINFNFGVGGSSYFGGSSGGSSSGGEGGGFPTEENPQDFYSMFRSIPEGAREPIREAMANLTPSQQQVFTTGFNVNTGAGWGNMARDAALLNALRRGENIPTVEKDSIMRRYYGGYGGGAAF